MKEVLAPLVAHFEADPERLHWFHGVGLRGAEWAQAIRATAPDSPAPVAWADQFWQAAPFAWMLCRDGKPVGIPVAHRPSDWEEVERVWNATFTPLYAHPPAAPCTEGAGDG